MTGRMRKTRKMLAVERRFETPLEELLPEMLTEYSLTDAAEQLGVNKATLSYWALKLGINVVRIALRPGERVQVVRKE